MSSSATRCDQIIALIDACLAELDPSQPAAGAPDDPEAPSANSSCCTTPGRAASPPKPGAGSAATAGHSAP
jgi:hypothetical protein